MNRSEFERFENVAYPYIFRKSIPAGDSGHIGIPLTGHGYVTKCTINFAAGENGTLHIRPYVIHPGELINDLLKYPSNANQYVSGDGQTYELPCYQEVENHSELRIWYENTGGVGTADSELMVDCIVQYDAIIQPRNVIG